MPWVVVEFLPHRGFEDFTVQTIPHSWVSNETGCLIALYPPVEFPSAAVQRMIKRQQQPAETWDKLPCSYATDPFDDILAAIQLEVEVANCDETDLEAFVTTLNKGGKRRRKERHPRYPGEPDTELENSEDELSDPPSPPDTMRSRLSNFDATRKASSHTKLPRLLKRSAQTAAASILQMPGCSGHGSLVQSVVQSSKALRPVQSPQVLSLALSRDTMSVPFPQSKFAKTLRVDGKAHSKLPTACGNSSPGHEMAHASNNDSASGSVDSSITELKDFIQRGLDDLKRELKNEMRKEIRAQIALSSSKINETIEALSFQIRCLPQSEGAVSENTQLMHTLPILRIEDLEKFEEEISSNSDYRQFMVHHLRDRSSNLLFRNLTEKLFVTAVNKTVNDIMSLLMGNALGMQFCMKGRNPCKVSFEKYFPRTIDLVFEVIKSKNGTAGPQLELVTIGRSIGEWFRLARLRGGAAKSGAAADGPKE